MAIDKKFVDQLVFATSNAAFAASYLVGKKNKIEASHSAALAWLDEVKLESERTMFLKTSNSWYLGTNVKGKPKGFIPYSGGLDKYTNICNAIAQNGYKGFIIS